MTTPALDTPAAQLAFTLAVFPAYKGYGGTVTFIATPTGLTVEGNGPAFALATGEIAALGYTITDGLVKA